MKTMSEKKRESGSSAERMYLKEDNTFDQMQPSYRQGIPESKTPYPFLADWNVHTVRPGRITEKSDTL